MTFKNTTRHASVSACFFKQKSYKLGVIMDNKSFLTYIGGKINNTVGLFGGLITIGAILKKQPTQVIMIIVLTTCCLVFLFSLFKIHKDNQNLKNDFNKNKENYDMLKRKYEKLEIQFNNQSEKYAKNIKLNNKYQKVVHVVDMFVNSTDTQSKSEKALLKKLEYSLEKSMEGNINDEL